MIVLRVLPLFFRMPKKDETTAIHFFVQMHSLVSSFCEQCLHENVNNLRIESSPVGVSKVPLQGTGSSVGRARQPHGVKACDRDVRLVSGLDW